MSDFGEFIRARRRTLGLTQTETARMAGMARPYLSLVERDGRWPQKYVTGLAKALQLSEAELALAAGKISDDHQPITEDGPENYLLYLQIARTIQFRETSTGIEVRAQVDWIDLERLMEWVQEFRGARADPPAYMKVPSARSALIRLCYDMVDQGTSDTPELNKRREALSRGLELIIESMPLSKSSTNTLGKFTEIKTLAVTRRQKHRW